MSKFGEWLQSSKSILSSILSQIPRIALRQNFISKNERSAKKHDFLTKKKTSLICRTKIDFSRFFQK